MSFGAEPDPFGVGSPAAPVSGCQRLSAPAFNPLPEHLFTFQH